MADEHDRLKDAEVKEAISKILNPLISRAEIVPSEDSRHSENFAVSDEEASTKGEKLRIVLNAGDAAKLRRVLAPFRRHAPVQGRLLRQSALINLIIYLEAALSDLLQFYYTQNPKALPSERTFTLTDLRELGSIEDAEKSLIFKEIEGVLRAAFDDQLSYLVKKMKIELKCLDEHTETLIEIHQRRNLFVHNRGVVNKIYLSKVSREYIDRNSVLDGSFLEVSDRYLAKATDVVFLCGLILIQQCWRKWEKGSTNDADQVLITTSFEALTEQRWHLAKNIAAYADTISPSDVCIRMVSVNSAIAARELGEKGAVKKLEDKFDWSACALKFKLALAALKEEDDFFNLMPRAVAAEEVTRDDLMLWPLFSKIRENPRFEEVLNQCCPLPEIPALAEPDDNVELEK
ncbi:hypothetical protein IAD21_03108 [Abditibacteriota bacterium]|nr:hypothetical protein IAD21_03108 [Abditibacteriota bacterium]